MLETSARLLRLLSLLQSTRDWTGPELADRLDVSPRTVRKDVDRLRNLGYAIDATRGAAGGYRLGIGTAMPPLLLDDDEAVAIVIGLSQVSHSGVSGTEVASISALTKIEQMLPSRLRNRVNALHEASTRVPDDSPPPGVDSEVLGAIATSRRNREKVRIGYTRHDGATSRRIVEPHHLVNWGRRWYLVAWDEDRDDWRTFRVDRIASVHPTGLTFTSREPPESDISRYIALNVSRAGWTYTATFEVAASVEEVLARINPAVGTVEPIDDSLCILRSGADDLSTIAVNIGTLGYEFRVLDPPELTTYLRDIAERYLRAIG
jgi:predicted DNA-binding transcriptional regulator YafY